MMKKINKIISLALCFCLLFNQTGFSQTVGAELNLSGLFNSISIKPAQDTFRPIHLRYLSYDSQTNAIKLFLDKGNGQGLSPQGTVPEETLKPETKKLFDYFLIGLALPNETFWVNLRPDSPDNIIDPLLGNTDVGRIFLEADVQLKKDTASFTSPATPEGKKYWDALYKKAEELFGYDNITIPTLTRPWIVPGEIILREAPDNAYIYKATLKVMLEQDYLANSKSPIANGTDYSFNDPRLKELNEYASQLIRELIIPKLTRDVNTSQRYAALRQVYYSLILAQWFKARFVVGDRHAYPLQAGNYCNLINSQNLSGLISQFAWDKQFYFQQYQDSFNKGEYNLQDQHATPFGRTIRTYTSGGIVMGNAIAENIQAQAINTNRDIGNIPADFISSPVVINGDGIIQPAQISPVKLVPGLGINEFRQFIMQHPDLSVGMGHFQGSNTQLATMGAANCVVPILMDYKDKECYLGHFPYVVPRSYSEEELNSEFYDFMTVLKGLVGEGSLEEGRYELYLFGGGAITSSGDLDKEIEKAKKVTEKVMQVLSGINKNLEPKFIRPEDPTASLDRLIADVENGKIEYSYGPAQAISSPVVDRESMATAGDVMVDKLTDSEMANMAGEIDLPYAQRYYNYGHKDEHFSSAVQDILFKFLNNELSTQEAFDQLDKNMPAMPPEAQSRDRHLTREIIIQETMLEAWLTKLDMRLGLGIHYFFWDSIISHITVIMKGQTSKLDIPDFMKRKMNYGLDFIKSGDQLIVEYQKKGSEEKGKAVFTVPKAAVVPAGTSSPISQFFKSKTTKLVMAASALAMLSLLTVNKLSHQDKFAVVDQMYSQESADKLTVYLEDYCKRYKIDINQLQDDIKRLQAQKISAEGYFQQLRILLSNSLVNNVHLSTKDNDEIRYIYNLFVPFSYGRIRPPIYTMGTCALSNAIGFVLLKSLGVENVTYQRANGHITCMVEKDGLVSLVDFAWGLMSRPFKLADFYDYKNGRWTLKPGQEDLFGAYFESGADIKLYAFLVPTTPTIIFNNSLSVIYSQSKLFEEAVQACEAALKEAKLAGINDTSFIYGNIADAYKEAALNYSGHEVTRHKAARYINKAVEAYRNIVINDPGYPGISADLAASYEQASIIYTQLKDTYSAGIFLNSAIKTYKADLGQNPNNAESNFQLGRLYYKYGHNLTEAEKYYQKAARLDSSYLNKIPSQFQNAVRQEYLKKGSSSPAAASSPLSSFKKFALATIAGLTILSVQQLLSQHSAEQQLTAKTGTSIGVSDTTINQPGLDMGPDPEPMREIIAKLHNISFTVAGGGATINGRFDEYVSALKTARLICSNKAKAKLINAETVTTLEQALQASIIIDAEGSSDILKSKNLVIYPEINSLLREIAKYRPDLIPPGSLAETVVNLSDEEAVALQFFPWENYLVYPNHIFKEKIKGEIISPEERYSMALAVHRILTGYKIELNDTNIAKATDFIMKKREAFKEKIIFGPETKVINIANKDFAIVGAEEMEKRHGVKAENIQTFQGVEDKQAILDSISTAPGPLSIYVSAHGWPDRISLGNGVYLYLEDLSGALKNRPKETGDVNIIFDQCFSYNYSGSLQKSIDIQQNQQPTLITIANKNRVGMLIYFNRDYSDMFLYADILDNTSLEGQPITGKGILGLVLSQQDPAIFYPSTPEDIKEIEALFGINIDIPVPLEIGKNLQAPDENYPTGPVSAGFNFLLLLGSGRVISNKGRSSIKTDIDELSVSSPLAASSPVAGAFRRLILRDPVLTLEVALLGGLIATFYPTLISGGNELLAKSLTRYWFDISEYTDWNNIILSFKNNIYSGKHIGLSFEILKDLHSVMIDLLVQNLTWDFIDALSYDDPYNNTKRHNIGIAIALAGHSHRFISQASEYIDNAVDHDQARKEILWLATTARQDLDIEFLNRFSLDELKEIVKNRQASKPDGRPLAVVVYPKSDYNGAFYKSEIIGSFTNHGYRVMYFETSTDQKMIEYLKRASETQKASVIILGGHGVANALTLTANDDAEGALSLQDERLLKDERISEVLEDSGQIILESCSTGEGKEKGSEEDGDNLANMMRRVFPNAKVRGIYSPTAPGTIVRVVFDANNKFQDVDYSVDKYQADLDKTRVDFKKKDFSLSIEQLASLAYEEWDELDDGQQMIAVNLLVAKGELAYFWGASGETVSSPLAASSPATEPGGLTPMGASSSATNIGGTSLAAASSPVDAERFQSIIKLMDSVEANIFNNIYKYELIQTRYGSTHQPGELEAMAGLQKEILQQIKNIQGLEPAGYDTALYAQEELVARLNDKNLIEFCRQRVEAVMQHFQTSLVPGQLDAFVRHLDTRKPIIEASETDSLYAKAIRLTLENPGFTPANEQLTALKNILESTSADKIQQEIFEGIVAAIKNHPGLAGEVTGLSNEVEAEGDQSVADLLLRAVDAASVASSPIAAIEQSIAEANGIIIQSGVVTAHQRQWDISIDNKSESARYLRVGKVIITDEELILPEAISAKLKEYDIIRIKGFHRGKGIGFDRFIIPIIGAMMSDGVNNAIIEDDGIGEGVLSLVALRQGARRIVGIDTDTATLKNAKIALEKSGYKGVYLNAQEWQAYVPGEDNQFILINDSLLNWFSLSPQGRSKIAGGAINLRMSNTGPFYADLYGHILKDIIIDNPQTKSILGAYVNGAGNGGNIFAATVDSLKGAGRELGFSAYSDENAKVWTSITVMPNISYSRVEPSEKMLEAVSSPVVDSQAEKKGGIDFRALPVVTQPIAGTVLKVGQEIRLENRPFDVDLDRQLQQIKKMIDSGIMPSNERLKEYAKACCAKENSQADIDKVLSCIAGILRMEEDGVQATDPQLRQMTALLESGKPMNEIQQGLAGISFTSSNPIFAETP